MAWNTATVEIGTPTKKSFADQIIDNLEMLGSGTISIYGEKTYKSATVFESAISALKISGTVTVSVFSGSLTIKSATVFQSTVAIPKISGTVTINKIGDIKIVSSANHTVLDDDGYRYVDVTTGASDRTIALPTASANENRQLKITKVDSGAGKVIVDGEGAELINDYATWEITEEYGYVCLRCNGTKWFVDSQWGCIYEISNSGEYALTVAWVDYYSLSGLTAGRYRIYFSLHFQAGAATVTTYGTIATAVDTEDNTLYSVVQVSGNAAEKQEFSKEFYREFAGATTLYLNAKEMGGAGNIENANAQGIIRAERVS